MILNYRDKAKEVLSICNDLCDVDYPDCLLDKIKNKIKHKKRNKNDHQGNEKRNYVGLPYFEGFTNVNLEFYKNSILAFIGYLPL